MLLLYYQSELAGDAVKHAFETSPDSVFGVLIGVLLLLLISVGVLIRWLIKAFYQNYQKVQEKTNIRFERLNNENTAIYKEYIEVLTNVVQANTLSNNKLVRELESHRENTKSVVTTISDLAKNSEQTKILVESLLHKVA